MKSIFVLCDFGIAYNTVERLYENNIKIYDIVNNPDCLNDVLGTRSQKADRIKEIIIDVVSSKNDYSIYDLMHCGLSKGIVQLLLDKKIKFTDINENLLKKDFISESTYRKIMKSYENFIKENNIKFELDCKTLLNFIKSIFKYEEFNIDELKYQFEGSCYELNNLETLLMDLLSKKILRKIEDKFSLIKPKLINELDKINKDNNHYDIVLKKLNGQTLESIGNEYNVTRERIRQIIQKELKKISKTREEEKYQEVFETYNFDVSLFCEFYNENANVYYYLREKYKLGEKDPSDMIDEMSLSKNQLNVLKKKYNLISYNGENISVKKK